MDFFRDVAAVARDAFGEVLGEMLGWVLALVAVGIPLLLVLYFVMKKMGVQVNFGRSRRSAGVNFQFQRLDPEVYRLGNAEIQKAAQLHKEGKDLDTICREVNPDYANWDSMRQQAFQSVMNEVLKTPTPPAN